MEAVDDAILSLDNIYNDDTVSKEETIKRLERVADHAKELIFDLV